MGDFVGLSANSGLIVVGLAVIILMCFVYVLRLRKAGATERDGPGEGGVARMDVSAAGEPALVNTGGPGLGPEPGPEIVAVIAAAAAACIDAPLSQIRITPVGPRFEANVWAMAGRNRIMQSRDMVRRRARF